MKTAIVSLMLVLNSWQPDHTPGWAAFVAGDFSRAREEGAAAKTADGLALACRSGLVIGGFRATGKDVVLSLHRALQDCEAALEIDPHNIVASVSYSLALGYEGKRLKKASYIKASRERLEHCLEHHPGDPLVLAALGGWHSAVSNAGFLARLALGGSRDQAEQYFTRAIELDSTSIGTRFEYVRFLARGDNKERSEALTQLAIVLALPPADAAEKIMKERLAQLIPMLEANDKKGVRERVMETAAFRDIADWRDFEGYPLVPIENYKS
ncbi:tetratricopeptide repeat protein [Kordiimonas sp.]|uniref:tetratricopeptide repeat protein n=1 Tax=Kordiimonas sp. TaxID=1970157 RepID=UPI003A8FE94D